MKKTRSKKSKKSELLIMISSSTLALAIVILAIGIYLVKTTPTTTKENPKPDEQLTYMEQLEKDVTPQIEITSDSPELKKVVEKISNHMLLPKGKIAVVTINNIDDLKQQNPFFFKHAKNGDQLLYYPNGIILYNPKVDKIIDILHPQLENTSVTTSTTVVTE